MDKGNGSDAAIRANSSQNLVVEHCIFKKMDKTYRFKQGHTGTFRNNWVFRAGNAIKGDGANGFVKSQNNIFVNLRKWAYETSEGAKIEDLGSKWYRWYSD